MSPASCVVVVLLLVSKASAAQISEGDERSQPKMLSKLFVAFDPEMTGRKDYSDPDNTRAIQQYFTSLVESVNRRFATIANARLRHIVQDVYEWKDMDEMVTPIAGRRGDYDGDLMLLEFHRFFRLNLILEYDVMVLFTSRPLFRRVLGRYERSRSAFVVPGQACHTEEDKAVAKGERRIQVVVEDVFGMYPAVRMLTEALAELYGCPGDGDGESKSCSPDDAFVMGLVDVGSRNNFFFSPCSQKILARNLKLFWESRRCLFHAPDVHTYPFTPLPFPGYQVLALEDQCSATFGRDVDGYRQVAGTEICDSFECVGGRGEVVGRMSAYEGTPCGDQKICWYGRCLTAAEMQRFCPTEQHPPRTAESVHGVTAFLSSDKSPEVERPKKRKVSFSWWHKHE